MIVKNKNKGKINKQEKNKYIISYNKFTILFVMIFIILLFI